MKQKYNGNGHNIYQFPVKFFLHFFRSVFISVNGIKIFPLTDISVSVFVNVNHTATKFFYYIMAYHTELILQFINGRTTKTPKH